MSLQQKICPACGHPNEMFAEACKNCGQVFGVPVPHWAHYYRPGVGAPMAPIATQTDGFAIASLILGIFSIASLCICLGFVGIPFGILGIIFGYLGLKKGLQRGLAITGLVLSIVGLTFDVGYTVVLAIGVANQPTTTYSVGN